MPRTGIRCFLFPMAPPSTIRGIGLLALATLRTLAVLVRTRPRVALATGGYVSTPVTLAAWSMRIPVILFLPDVVPGKAVAWLTPFARRIAASTESALAYLPPGKTVVTGYPVRNTFRAASRDKARARFGLPDDAAVLSVFGGSQGSRSINEALAAHLPSLLARHHVIHICGEQRWPEAQRAAANLPDEQRDRYLLFPYLHDEEMADALAAADLALCRSGASTLGELPATGTPAVLVPLPEAAVHQQENAEYLAAAGAAVVLPDAELPARLGALLDGLLGNQTELDRMAAACRSLDRPEAAEAIAALLLAEAA